ncbi:MAG: hypothetical protein LLG04_17595 [Parachlamydia sp.]|nr:hypothetical protein [Parachlamydia sp.]
MEVSDVIGFIVSVFVMLFIIGRHVFSERRRQQHPEEAKLEERKQKETLKNFLKSLDVEMDELDEEEEMEARRPPVIKKAPPPPPQIVQKPQPHRKVQDDFRFQTKVEQRRFETSVEQRRLETAVEKRKRDFGANIISQELLRGPDAYSRALTKTQKPSYGTNLIARIGSKKEMVILQEILNPPKAFGPSGYRDKY